MHYVSIELCRINITIMYRSHNKAIVKFIVTIIELKEIFEMQRNGQKSLRNKLKYFRRGSCSAVRENSLRCKVMSKLA